MTKSPLLSKYDSTDSSMASPVFEPAGSAGSVKSSHRLSRRGLPVTVDRRSIGGQWLVKPLLVEALDER